MLFRLFRMLRILCLNFQTKIMRQKKWTLRNDFPCFMVTLLNSCLTQTGTFCMDIHVYHFFQITIIILIKMNLRLDFINVITINFSLYNSTKLDNVRPLFRIGLTCACRLLCQVLCMWQQWFFF